jgi:serine/threonine protein phosphatase 1
MIVEDAKWHRIALQTPKAMMWIRSEFLSSDADFGKIAVRGRTITCQAEIRNDHIGIGAGAFATCTLIYRKRCFPPTLLSR